MHKNLKSHDHNVEIILNFDKEKFQLWSGMKVVVPSKSVPNQKWRCDPNRTDKSHLLIIKEEKNQVVIIKISQGIHSQPIYSGQFTEISRPSKIAWLTTVHGSVVE